MPRLSAYLVRTALLYLAAGFTLGGLVLFHKGVPLAPWAWRLLPLHTECVLVGWTTQFALGVAYWAFPRFARGPARGRSRPAWLAYGLLNVGVGCVLAGSLWSWPPAVLVGRAAELGAVALMAMSLWPRVKPLGA